MNIKEVPASWPLTKTRKTSRMLSIFIVGLILFASQNATSSSETCILQFTVICWILQKVLGNYILF